MRDVAERAGVSVGTISNVLNRPDFVSGSTQERVRKAIQETGFVRNGAARQLRGIRSSAIGLVVLDIGNPFFAEVARGVEDAASAIDHLVILCNSAGDQAREERHLQLLEEQRVAGVLMTPARQTPSALQKEIVRRGTPVVLLDRRSTSRNQCSVAVDDVEGGRLAANHLLEQGHKRLAVINGPRSITQCAERREGFMTALDDAGLTLAASNDLEMDEMTMPMGRIAAERLLAQKAPPTAIFCTNDLLALGAETAVLTQGRRVPDDVALVGYDDVAFAAMALVPLTTIRQPAYELGYRSAQLLLEEASAVDHRHEHVVFRPELVVRESTAAR
jgi:LacI family transcriptional regulator